MDTIDLLNALNPFVLLSSAIAKTFPTGTGYKRQNSLSLSYNTIRLKQEKIKTETGSDRFPTREDYFQCTFQINSDLVSLTEIYCEQSENENLLREFISRHTPVNGFVWGTDITEAIYPPETESFLAIADTIAKEAYGYDLGDDYRPGYFTEIIVEQNQIILRQINRHNSRSIDHKKDYFLRELEFFIPINDARDEIPEQGETIGKMRIYFSDHSSRQNKSGGDRIRQKIDQEKLNFSK